MEGFWTGATPHSILLCQDLDALLQLGNSCLASACVPSIALPHPQASAKSSHTAHAASSLPLWAPQEGMRSLLTLQKLPGW